MKFFTIQPPPQLAGVVNHFWVSMCNHSEKEIFTYYSIAETYAKFVFMYKIAPDGSLIIGKDFYSAFQGQSHIHEQFLTPGAFEIFGVNLHPAAVPRLTGLPAPDVSNLTLGLPDLFGRQGKELNEQMACAGAVKKRLSAITGFLENRLKRNPAGKTAIQSAIRTIQVNEGNVDISVLAKDHFLSRKQFKRKFLEESGLTPKLFARITRFETALCRYRNYRSLAEMAHGCGYYDQSHFIRDFREFSGFPPRKYFEVAGDQL